MAVAFDGGVVVGADSRVSTGVYISNRASDKITSVDERIFCCRSGSAADTQAVSDYVTYFLDQHRMEYGRPPKVATAAICAMLIRICSPLASSSLAGTRSRAAKCTLCLLEALCLSDNMRLAVRVLRSFTVFATLTTRKE